MSNLTDALIAAKLVGGSGGSGGGSLPAVTEADNGNVLTVVGGAWDKAAPSGGGYTVPEVVFEYHVSGQSYEIVRPTYNELIEMLGDQKSAPIVFTQKTIMNDRVFDYNSYSGQLQRAGNNVYINASEISLSVGGSGDQITTMLYYFRINNTDSLSDSKIVQNSVKANPVT